MIWRTCVQAVEDVRRPADVTFRCFLNCHQLGHLFGAGFTAVAERDLAKHDQWTKHTLGQIVRRRNARVVDEDQPLVRMPANPALQSERFLVFQRTRFQSQQFLTGAIKRDRSNSTVLLAMASGENEGANRRRTAFGHRGSCMMGWLHSRCGVASKFGRNPGSERCRSRVNLRCFRVD